MRDIKFRAWYPERQKMYEVAKVDMWGDPDQAICDLAATDEELFDVYLNEVKIMQCTGLKDSSGKEIYEGDLMMWLSQDTDDSIMQDLYEIVFRDGGFMAKHYGGCSPLYEDLRTYLVVRDYELLEVVGNIFEESMREVTPTGEMDEAGNDLTSLIDAEIARQSVKSEDVAEAIEAGMTREEHLAQRMKSWRFRLWYRWYGFLFKIKMMLGRDVK